MTYQGSLSFGRFQASPIDPKHILFRVCCKGTNGIYLAVLYIELVSEIFSHTGFTMHVGIVMALLHERQFVIAGCYRSNII